MHRPTANEVETFTGLFVDTKNPRPETICIEDIAHSLANICRYGGHCSQFYSVAEHSVFVSKRLERRGHGSVRQLGGLLHDASESYLGDIPRPLKPLLGAGYKRLTEKMDAAIAEALGVNVSIFHDDEIKSADNWSLLVEAGFLLPSRGVNWAGSDLDAWAMHDAPSRIIVPDYWLGGVAPVNAEQLFLDRYKELTT